MKAIIIIGINASKVNIDYSKYFVVAVDKGVDFAINNNICVDLAIGDFDSTANYNKMKNVIKLNPIKDVTDTMYAVNYLKDYEEIIIVGGIQGKRIEHFIANIKLFYVNKKITFIDNYSKIFIVNNNMIIKKEDYDFISFYALENVLNLNLVNTKYELNNYNLLINDPLCVSNEFLKDEIYVKYDDGLLMAIMSKKD